MKPTLKTWTEKNGAAVAELEVATPNGLSVYRASMRPGEVAEVRRRVERMAASHNANLQGYVRGTDPDDVLPANWDRGSQKTSESDPDALMEPSYSKKKPPVKSNPPPRKMVSTITVGPAVIHRGPFKKLLYLGRTAPPSSSNGAAAVFVPAAGGLHCIRMPDGRIQPTRIFHCRSAGDVAASVVGGCEAMTYGDVNRIAEAHVRSALVGRLAAKIPSRVKSSLVRSEVGVTGFKRPDENFVDDAYREEQMLRATQSGPTLMDKYLHDGVMGVLCGLEEIEAGPQEIDGTFAGEEIEEGVYDGLPPYSRGEIVRPEEVMSPPDDVLEAGTVLEESVAPPKSTYITPHEVNGEIDDYLSGRDEQDLIEEHEDRDPSAESVGFSLKKIKRGISKGVRKASGGLKKASGAIKKASQKTGSRIKQASKKTAGAVKSAAKAAVNLKQFVPGRDSGKQKLTKDTYKKAWKKISLGLAFKRGSKQPTVTERNQAQLKAKAILKKYGMPVDKLGWTAAGLTEIPRAIWEASGDYRTPGTRLTGDWASGCLAIKRAADSERRKQISSLRGLHPTTASMLGADIAVDAAINDDLNGIIGSWKSDADGSTVLVGSWWNPLSWFQKKSKAALAEADLLAQSPEDLPELPPGAEGGPPADEAPADEAPADEAPADEAPADEAPADEAPEEYPEEAAE